MKYRDIPVEVDSDGIADCTTHIIKINIHSLCDIDYLLFMSPIGHGLVR